MKKISTLALLTLCAGQCYAIDASVRDSEIVFIDRGSDSISVSVSGPDGFNASYAFDGGFAALQTSQINQGKDGSYYFDAVSVTVIGQEYAEASNGREAGMRNLVDSETSSGHFRIRGGSLVQSVEEKIREATQ
ncbi:MAG: hypothetical protein CMI00_06835 [Oceanospirillaceae bacterium]|nr:hypothetical protein [Oceanospirillaceae bacterium]|tara:strand:+ start:44218 stop:44619 length:402 start_codon:yes stop_codon:yes gene_type:complete